MERIRPGIHGDRVGVSLLPLAQWADPGQDWIPRDNPDDDDRETGETGETGETNGAARLSSEAAAKRGDSWAFHRGMRRRDEAGLAGDSWAFHRAVSGRVVRVVRAGPREFVCSVWNGDQWAFGRTPIAEAASRTRC